MMTALASGILLGLSAGLSPGPLLALVLTQTLRYGPREGCKIALTPLLTDAPIIVLALLAASKLTAFRSLLGCVSLAGGVFVLYLAWDSLRPARLDQQGPTEIPRSWSKGVLTNLLSPHPWIFWLTVGAAVLAEAIAQSWLVAAAFLSGFYLLLIGSKVMIAVLAGGSRALLSGRPYRLVMRVLALLLVCFAVLLLRGGWKLLVVN